MSVLPFVGGDEKDPERQDRWNPYSDEYAVQLVVDRALVGKIQPNAEEKTRERR